MTLDIRKLVGKLGSVYDDPFFPELENEESEEVDIRSLVR